MKHRYFGRASEWDQYEFRRIYDESWRQPAHEQFEDRLIFWICAVLLGLLVLMPLAAAF